MKKKIETSIIVKDGQLRITAMIFTEFWYVPDELKHFKTIAELNAWIEEEMK